MTSFCGFGTLIGIGRTFSEKGRYLKFLAISYGGHWSAEEKVKSHGVKEQDKRNVTNKIDTEV